MSLKNKGRRAMQFVARRFGGRSALGVAALALVLTMAGVSELSSRPAQAAHGSPIELLARAQFPDQVSAIFMSRLAGAHPLRVVHVPEAGDIVNVKVTLHPGESIDWHLHPGPGVVTVAEGTLTITYAIDCQPREYALGQAFLDGGSGVHRADNFGGDDVVVYVTFLGIPPGTPATIPQDDPGC